MKNYNNFNILELKKSTYLNAADKFDAEDDDGVSEIGKELRNHAIHMEIMKSNDKNKVKLFGDISIFNREDKKLLDELSKSSNRKKYHPRKDKLKIHSHLK